MCVEFDCSVQICYLLSNVPDCSIGFVILMGTDTMAYAASALTFMLQNLGKPVIFTGSQIPLREPYNDARKNLIMATIFASSDTMSEVAIFFRE